MSDDASITSTRWLPLLERALINMSPLQECGELRLVAAIIANAMHENMISAHRAGYPFFREAFFTKNFQAYCRVIGVDPDQIMSMTADSWDKVMVMR